MLICLWRSSFSICKGDLIILKCICHLEFSNNKHKYAYISISKNHKMKSFSSQRKKTLNIACSTICEVVNNLSPNYSLVHKAKASKTESHPGPYRASVPFCCLRLSPKEMLAVRLGERLQTEWKWSTFPFHIISAQPGVPIVSNSY